MDDCAFFCDGVWTWREYLLASIPFVFCFIAVAWTTYEDEDFFFIAVGGAIGLAIGTLFALLGSLILEAFPQLIIWLALIVAVFFAGWILGKIANWIAWMKRKN